MFYSTIPHDSYASHFEGRVLRGKPRTPQHTTSDYGKSGENTLNRLGFHIGRDCRVKYGTMSEEAVERGDIQEEDVIIGDEACASANGTSREREAYPNFTSAFKRNVSLNSREDALIWA
ncbi:hypothetical protein Scep_029653 [Stephania cephalantha]|uniref:Uncharacterized protein n=1 Tax=Stephania cephalantha TaxID=152367 RepID=A0AAP0E1P1_9MAGN